MKRIRFRPVSGSIRENTSYKHYEILIVENNSTTDEIFEYYKQLSKEPGCNDSALENGVFNYSAINNFGAKNARGEYLLFLNNDITVITSGLDGRKCSVCARDGKWAAVGAKLIYPDNTIQHAGCVVGMGGIAGHMFVDMPAERTGYLHKASLLQDMSAVTAACMMVKRNAFEKAGGFTQELAVAFNDVDLCLKIRREGYLVVYDPYAKLYHMESKTRGLEDSKDKVRRFQTEIEYMRSHWIEILKKGDPYYNKNLSLTKWNYSLKPLPEDEEQERSNKEEYMQEVEVSVVIPNYNGMAYLDGVLSSLECQTFRDFEVILVDNGSADGSTCLCSGQLSLGTGDRASR